MLKIKVYIILLLLLLPSLCFSQAKKTRIAVVHAGSDSVGQSFAFALKEAIRGSRSFVLFENDYKNPAIVIRVVSVEGFERKDISSAFAVAIVYDSVQTQQSGILLDLMVQSCGRDRVAQCANRILPAIDQALDDLRRNNLDLWENVSIR